MNLSDRDCRPLHATGTEPRIQVPQLTEAINTKPATSRRTRCCTSRYMQPFLLWEEEVLLRARIAGLPKALTSHHRLGTRAFASKTIHTHSQP